MAKTFEEITAAVKAKQEAKKPANTVVDRMTPKEQREYLRAIKRLL